MFIHNYLTDYVPTSDIRILIQISNKTRAAKGFLQIRFCKDIVVKFADYRETFSRITVTINK